MYPTLISFQQGWDSNKKNISSEHQKRSLKEKTTELLDLIKMTFKY